MLGEGARTDADAERYEAAYADAIAAVGEAAGGARAGGRPRHLGQALGAVARATRRRRRRGSATSSIRACCGSPHGGREHDINFTLDAEEADRLVLSLKLLERLAREPALGGWRGLGLAVQAYQKRAPDGDRRRSPSWRGDSGRRLMVRLVKGAYWDAEIKRAQVGGRPDYPVFTTKAGDRPLLPRLRRRR